MRVFVTGATGVLGARLVERLSRRGHAVVGLVRDEAGKRSVEARGGTPVEADLFDAGALVEAAPDADVVVHTATSMPEETALRIEDWRENDRVRVEGTRAALEAASRVRADQFLTHSVVRAFRTDDGSAFDETASPNVDRTTASAVEAEELVDHLGREYGLGTAVLRFGWLYGPGSGQLRRVAKRLLAGRLWVIGNGLLGRRGETVLSLVHAEDAARAVVRTIETGATGRWHVVDDEPAPTDAFFGELARLLEVSEPGRIPAWLAKLFVGDDVVRFFTESVRTSNDRFADEVGWEPVHPTFRDGLESTVETWLAEGRLDGSGDGYAWDDDVEETVTTSRRRARRAGGR